MNALDVISLPSQLYIGPLHNGISFVPKYLKVLNLLALAVQFTVVVGKFVSIVPVILRASLGLCFLAYLKFQVKELDP